MLGPAVTAAKADAASAARLVPIGVNHQPDFWDTATPDTRSMFADNARTIPLAFLTAPPPPPVTCDQLHQIKIPVLITYGGDTRAFYRIAAEDGGLYSRCHLSPCQAAAISQSFSSPTHSTGRCCNSLQRRVHGRNLGGQLRRGPLGSIYEHTHAEDCKRDWAQLPITSMLPVVVLIFGYCEIHDLYVNWLLVVFWAIKVRSLRRPPCPNFQSSPSVSSC